MVKKIISATQFSNVFLHLEEKLQARASVQPLSTCHLFCLTFDLSKDWRLCDWNITHGHIVLQQCYIVLQSNRGKWGVVSNCQKKKHEIGSIQLVQHIPSLRMPQDPKMIWKDIILFLKLISIHLHTPGASGHLDYTRQAVWSQYMFMFLAVFFFLSSF